MDEVPMTPLYASETEALRVVPPATAAKGLAVVVAAQDRAAGLDALAGVLRLPAADLAAHDGLAPALAGASPVVVVCAPALMDLAQMMADGLAPTAALERWTQTTAALIADLRPYRRRVTLLDRAALSAPGPEFCAALSARLGLAVTPPAESPDLAPDVIPEPSPVLFALAQMLLGSDPRAARLAAELDAMMLIDRGNGLRDTPAALAELAFAAISGAEQARGQVAEQIALLAAERDLMADQLAVIQAGIEADIGDQAALEAELAQTRDALAAQTARADDLVRDLLALGQSEEALQAELDLAHAAVASARRAETEAQARVDEARRELAALALASDSKIRAQAARITEETKARAEAEQREAEIRASTSWRITGPMRRLVRLVRRR